MNIRERAVEFINKLVETETYQIPHDKLKLAVIEFLETTDRGIIPMFIEYLKETKLIEMISNNRIQIYKINYENAEKLKETSLSWLCPKKQQEANNGGITENVSKCPN